MARERGGVWAWLGVAVLYPLTRLLARRRFEGLEHIPRSGPVLVVCNHISYLDPVYTAVFLRHRGRIPRFLAKAGLWRVPILCRALDGTGQIPVYRNDPAVGDSLRAAQQALRQGATVLIFPEGTITRDPDHWPMVARTGVARLVLSCDVPVVPVVHWGTHRVYDHYGRRFRPLPRGEAAVRAGAPLDLADLRHRPVDHRLLHEVTERVMGRVRDPLAEVRGEQAPVGFFTPVWYGDDREQQW